MDSILQSAWSNSILTNGMFGDRLRPDDLIYSSPSDTHRRGQVVDYQDKFQVLVSIYDYCPSDISVELVERKRAIAVTGRHNAEPHIKKEEAPLSELDDSNRHQSRSFSEKYYLPLTCNPSSMTYEFTPDQCRLIITVLKRGFERPNNDLYGSYKTSTKPLDPSHTHRVTDRPTSLAPLPDKDSQSGLKITPAELFSQYGGQEPYQPFQQYYACNQAQAAYDNNCGCVPTSLPPLSKTDSVAANIPNHIRLGPNYNANWFTPSIPIQYSSFDPGSLVDQLETMPSYYSSMSTPPPSSNVDSSLADAIKANSAKLEALLNASHQISNPDKSSVPRVAPSNKPGIQTNAGELVK